jgi:hypothetical protein
MAILSLLTARSSSKKVCMTDQDQSEKPGPEGSKPELTARVNALAADVEKLKNGGPARWGRVTLLLGVIATLLGVFSTALSLKGRLFPAPHTGVAEHGRLYMKYQPQSGALTFKVPVALCNDGNKEDVLKDVEATLETAHGPLVADRVDIVDKETSEEFPIIVIPGTLRLDLSPIFKYPPNEEGLVQLRIQFKNEKGKPMMAKVCFPVGQAALEKASEESATEPLELSEQNCESGRD